MFIKMRTFAVLAFIPESSAKEHWLAFGIQEGRKAHAYFSVKEYQQRYQDLEDAGLDYEDLIKHYLKYSAKEGRLGILDSVAKLPEGIALKFLRG